MLYRLFTVGVTDVSDAGGQLDHKIGHILSIVGIPSAFLLHGYVGFIFGSVKANPWWGNVLMPIIFIMSAMVSGIALCVFNYLVLSWIRRKTVDMKCLDVMGMFLFYALVVDAAIEGLDWIHRIYSAEEGFQVMQYHGAGEAVLHAEPGAGDVRHAGAADPAGGAAVDPPAGAGIATAADVFHQRVLDPDRACWRCAGTW